MLSYQHIYHAGNFADVQKHAILIRLLKTLRLKPGRLSVLDTHAGRGLYDLDSGEAGKTGEFAQGIAAVWEKAKETGAAQKDISGTVRDYLDMIAAFNPQGGFRHYPGTAQIARRLLRPHDDLTCIEKHPGEFRELQDAMAREGGDTTLLQQDGFDALVDMVPLRERRGLVVIDPSYEIKSEYLDLPRRLEKAWRKWPQGTYMIWYPLLQALGHRHMLSALRGAKVPDIIVSEIRLEEAPKEDYRMQGTGIAIVNPPWPEAVLNDITQQIVKALPMKAYGDVFWLDSKRIDPDTGMIEI